MVPVSDRHADGVGLHGSAVTAIPADPTVLTEVAAVVLGNLDLPAVPVDPAFPHVAEFASAEAKASRDDENELGFESPALVELLGGRPQAVELRFGEGVFPGVPGHRRPPISSSRLPILLRVRV